MCKSAGAPPQAVASEGIFSLYSSMTTLLETQRSEINLSREALGMTISDLATNAKVDLRGLRRFFNDPAPPLGPTTNWLDRLYSALRVEEKRQARAFRQRT